MRCLLTTRSAIKKTVRKKNNKKSKNKIFTAKTPYIYIEPPNNNFKVQSGKTLTTQTYFSLATQQMGFFHDETR